MSEQGAQGGAAGQANQNNEQGQQPPAPADNTAGQSQSEDTPGAAGAALLAHAEQETKRAQGFLLQEFHKLIRSALYTKVEEVAKHEYLKAEEAIAAVVEWIKEEAGRLGWKVSDTTANAFASSALLDHKLDAQDHQAVTPPPPAAEQPAA